MVVEHHRHPSKSIDSGLVHVTLQALLERLCHTARHLSTGLAGQCQSTTVQVAVRVGASARFVIGLRDAKFVRGTRSPRHATVSLWEGTWF
jgi:hypothetical protein